MKRKILLSCLLVIALVVSVCLFTGCAVDDLEQKVDQNQTTVQTATQKVADDLAAARTELQNAIAAKADTATLNEKVQNLETAIENAKKELSDDAADQIKTAEDELKEFFGSQVQALEQKVNELKTTLEGLAGTKADGSVLTSEIAKLEAQVADLKTELEGQVADLKTGKVDVATYTAKVDELGKGIEKVANALESDLKDWDEATDVVADCIVKLGKLREETLKVYGEGGDKAELAPEGWLEEVERIYRLNKTRLYRALNKEVAEGALKFADTLYNTVDNCVDEYASIDSDRYYTEEWESIVALYLKAVEDIATYEYTTDYKVADITAIVTKFVEDVAAVDTKADIIYADLTKLGTSVEDITYTDGWKEQIELAEGKIAAEDPDLTKGWYAEWSDWTDLVDKCKEYRTRYDELGEFYSRAQTINSDIDGLTSDINSMTDILWEYTTRYNEISNAVSTWIGDFTEAFPAQSVTGDNYNMLDHVDYQTLKGLYDNKIDVLYDQAKAVKSAIDAVGTVSVMSKKAIEVAMTEYEDLILGEVNVRPALGAYKLFDENGNDLAAVYGNQTKSLKEQFLKLCREAIAAYTEFPTITINEKGKVKLNGVALNANDKPVVDAIVAWYLDYFKADAKVLESEFPTDPVDGANEFVLTTGDAGNSLTVTEEMFEQVKKLLAALDDPDSILLAKVYNEHLANEDDLSKIDSRIVNGAKEAGIDIIGLRARINACKTAIEALVVDGGVVDEANADLAYQTDLLELIKSTVTEYLKAYTAGAEDNLLAAYQILEDLSETYTKGFNLEEAKNVVVKTFESADD